MCPRVELIIPGHYPAEGYGIKYEGSFLEKSQIFLSFCLSPPLLGIIYIGLNQQFVDVSVVWSS